MKSRRIHTALILILCLCAAPIALADAGEWTGEVLDLNCYANGQKGEGHASCATRCLNNGSPMGLLVDGDVVYVDIEGSDEKAIATLKNLGGKNAKVAGDTSKDGEKTVIKVKSAAPADG